MSRKLTNVCRIHANTEEHAWMNWELTLVCALLALKVVKIDQENDTHEPN